MGLFIFLSSIRPHKTWNRHIHCGGFIFVHGGFIILNAFYIYELWIRQPHVWILHMFQLHVTLFIAGFISERALFILKWWIPPFAKRIRIFFNAIRQLIHESATFVRKKSRLPLLDISKSVLFLPYSFTDMAYSSFLHESAMLQNESGILLIKWIRHNIWCFLPFLGQDSFTIVAYSFIHMADSFFFWSE